MIPSYFLIPVKDNNGRPFRRAQFKQVTDRLITEFVGFTGPTIVSGMWRGDDGRVYSDRSHRYDVALDSWMQIPTLLEIVTWALVEFQQEAIFISIAGVPEIMAARPP